MADKENITIVLNDIWKPYPAIKPIAQKKYFVLALPYDNNIGRCDYMFETFYFDGDMFKTDKTVAFWTEIKPV